MKRIKEKRLGLVNRRLSSITRIFSLCISTKSTQQILIKFEFTELSFIVKFEESKKFDDKKLITVIVFK